MVYELQISLGPGLDLCGLYLGVCRFDFCKPGSDSRDKDPVENVGQVLMGEQLRASGYKVRDALRVMGALHHLSKGSCIEPREDGMGLPRAKDIGMRLRAWD